MEPKEVIEPEFRRFFNTKTNAIAYFTKRRIDRGYDPEIFIEIKSDEDLPPNRELDDFLEYKDNKFQHNFNRFKEKMKELIFQEVNHRKQLLLNESIENILYGKDTTEIKNKLKKLSNMIDLVENCKTIEELLDIKNKWY